MTRSVVVGLDIATVTGWARFDGATFTTGVIDCTTSSQAELEGVHFRKFAEQLPEVLKGAGAVVIERTYSRGKRTAEILNGLTAIALVQCEDLGLEYAFVDAVTLKLFATGSGRAQKADMVAAAERELGLSGLSDDEADAYFLVRYWQERLQSAAVQRRAA